VCCFEVGDEVAAQFHPDDVVRHAGAKPHVSLAGAVTRTLRRLGVNEANICADAECTRCHHERYFSARALGIASGRNFSFISLKHRSDM
jgi:copper oxidase (laccase) domain-containing protein